MKRRSQRGTRTPTTDIAAVARNVRPEKHADGTAVLFQPSLFRCSLTGFVLRELKVRYKQTVIGVTWAVAQPLLLAMVLALFFHTVGKIPSEGIPYFPFALAGIISWSYVARAAATGSESIVDAIDVMRKMYFPREVPPLAATISALVDLLIGWIILAIVAAGHGHTPTATWVALPVVVALLVIPTMAAAIVLSCLNAYYRDVRYILPIALQLGFFSSPVLYSYSQIPSSWRSAYGILNPFATAIDGMRRIMLHGQWPSLQLTFGALVWASVLAGAAYWFFKRIEFDLVDRV